MPHDNPFLCLFESDCQQPNGLYGCCGVLVQRGAVYCTKQKIHLCMNSIWKTEQTLSQLNSNNFHLRFLSKYPLDLGSFFYKAAVRRTDTQRVAAYKYAADSNVDICRFYTI